MKVYHFHNGAGGGVLSVIKNLLLYKQQDDIENHVIYTINKDLVEKFEILHLDGAASEQVFYYSPKWNFYYTCKQLAVLLPDEKTLIIAHDWMELGMASNLGLQNPVIQILHGDFDYYYELAKINSPVIDAFVCISSKMSGSLKNKLPNREDDIIYLNFPVQSVESKNRENDKLHLIYFVRDLKEERKQFSTIVEVARQLSDTPNDYYFTIAGGGMMAKEFFDLWPEGMKESVNFLGVQKNEEIITLLTGQDIFLLPSLAEGLPVSLVEAMKAGVVPLISNWDGAVDDLVSAGNTGYYCNKGDSVAYARRIKELNGDRSFLNKLSFNCMQRANIIFDPVENTKKFEILYGTVAAKRTRKKIPSKVYGSRLDHPLIPNFISSSIRKFK